MALRLFGFSCDAVRGEPDLVLVRTDVSDALWPSTRDERRRTRHARRISGRQSFKESRIRYTRGVVVNRRDAARMCLELLRRGIKPWSDPRVRRRAA